MATHGPASCPAVTHKFAAHSQLAGTLGQTGGWCKDGSSDASHRRYEAQRQTLRGYECRHPSCSLLRRGGDGIYHQVRFRHCRLTCREGGAVLAKYVERAEFAGRFSARLKEPPFLLLLRDRQSHEDHVPTGSLDSNPNSGWKVWRDGRLGGEVKIERPVLTHSLADDLEPELLTKAHDGLRSERKDSGHCVHNEVVVEKGETREPSDRQLT